MRKQLYPILFGGPRQYLGQVATRTWIPNFFNGTNKQQMSRAFHYARDNISSLQIVIPNFRVTVTTPPNTGEVGPGADATVTASIEYPAGTFAQVKFSGSASGTVPDGGMLTSDPVSVSIPNGAKFFSRVWYSCSAGIPYSTYGATGTSTGDGFAAGVTTADLTMSGTVTQATTVMGVLPAAIIARTRKKSVGIIGDSRPYGASDTGDASGDIGCLARSIGPTLAYINMAVPSDRAVDFTTGTHSLNRQALMAYVSNRALAMGINDLTNGTSAANIITALSTIAGYSSSPIWLATVAPKTTSTDSWATLANQTIFGQNSARVSLNASIRTSGVPGFSGYFEIADVDESARDSGKWVVSGATNYSTPDGTHENQAQNLRIQSAGVINPAVFR